MVSSAWLSDLQISRAQLKNLLKMDDKTLSDLSGMDYDDFSDYVTHLRYEYNSWTDVIRGAMQESKANESDGMQVDWWDSLSQDERNNYMNSFSQVNNTYPVNGTIYMDNYDEMDSSNQYYVKNLFTFVRDDMDNDLLGRNHDILEEAYEGLIDNIWGLLVNSSRMQFLDEYMGDMNIPLMITMGSMSMPQTNEEVADALGVSKSEALKFISKWAYDNGITDTVYTEAKASEGDWDHLTAEDEVELDRNIETLRKAFYRELENKDDLYESTRILGELERLLEIKKTRFGSYGESKSSGIPSGDLESTHDLNNLFIEWNKDFDGSRQEFMVYADSKGFDAEQAGGIYDIQYVGETNESWSQKSSIDRIEALEKLGIKQGDAIKLSGLEFEDFGEDLQGALKDDDEDKEEHGEVENPNIEFQQYYPDYNNIGESQTARTKYECEYCDHGFKSNEALSIHYNDKHAIAPESLDGYASEADCTNCGQSGVDPDPRFQLGSWCEDCQDRLELAKDNWWKNATDEEKRKENEWNDKPWESEFDGESKVTEADPDFQNDPDFQGYTKDEFGNKVKSHPSQYTASGWDQEKKERMNARGDVDGSEFYASEHNVGDYVTMTDDALDNYGQQYRGQSFRISHVAKSVDDHMGYDEGMGGENLYDLDGFNSSLYDYEVESTDELKQMWNESKASEFTLTHEQLTNPDTYPNHYYEKPEHDPYASKPDGCAKCGWLPEMRIHFNSTRWLNQESKATETISEDEKDEIFQYLFDLQESGATNMFGSGAYVERDFPHLDKREVGDVITEWMANWDEIATRMGIESYATENPTSDGYSWSADQDEISRIQFQTNLTKEEKNREIQKIEKRQQEQEDLELEADTPRNRTGYFESKETEHDDLSSGHQISDRYSNTYILFLQRWKQEHPDWKQNVDKTLSNFVKYMVKMGYNKRNAEMAWNDYLYSPESKANEVKCKNCQGKGWYLGDLNPNVSNDYGEIECEYCNGTGKDPKFGDESKASEDLAKVGDTILDPNGRNFSLHNKFNFNSGDPFCKICGESVIDEQGVWEDHLINTHGYYIVPWSKSSEGRYMIRDKDGQWQVQELTDDLELAKAIADDSSTEEISGTQPDGAKGVVVDLDFRQVVYSAEAGLEDHSCPECGFITSDNSDYVDHLNAHEE